MKHLTCEGIYRVIELSQGWSGPIITTEIYFLIFDGVMMIIAMGIFNILYPTWAFTKEDTQEDRNMELTTPKG